MALRDGKAQIRLRYKASLPVFCLQPDHRFGRILTEDFVDLPLFLQIAAVDVL